jgi:hypothetical protein
MQLNLKERQAVVLGVAVLAALVAAQFVLRPTLRRIETLERSVHAGEKALAQLRVRVEEHVRLKTDLAALRARLTEDKGGPGPLTLLETYEKEAGLQRNVAYMKTDKTPLLTPYVQTRVAVRLEGVSLDQTVALLQRIDAAPVPLGLRSLHLRASAKDPKSLDVVMEVVSVGKE